MDLAMQDNEFDHLDDGEELPKSKSQLKREMHALQDMGRRLTQLKPEQLAKVPMSETLAAAIAESHRIKQNEAIRRHMQRIGKLMRAEDADAIQQVLDEFDSSSLVHAKKFHELENWRDRLINGGPEALTEYLNQYPQGDHQHLRQLIRNAIKDVQEQKNRGHSKKLFQYLRECQEQNRA